MPTETKPSIYTALMKSQQDMGPLLKNATNPAFRSKYADLSSVIETITEPLHKNGLLVTHRLQYDGNDVASAPILITELVHAESGEKIESVINVNCQNPSDPQKVEGAITYFRRYSLLGLLGIAPEDDDGQVASTPATRPAATTSQRQVDTQTGEIVSQAAPTRSALPACPDCGGPMWDNRAKKASGEYAQNRPDFSCKKQGGDTQCRGAIWPAKDAHPREDDDFRSRTAVEEAQETEYYGGDEDDFNSLVGQEGR